MRLLFILLSVFTVSCLKAQIPLFDWVKEIGGNTYTSYNSTTVDALGNVYNSGSFSGTVDFDPGSGNSILTSAGNIDAFLQKMDVNGNLLWAITFGGIGYDRAVSITLDSVGDIYVAGSFEDTVDFDPGPDTVYLIAEGIGASYVQKLDADGNFLWVKAFGGASSNRSVNVDPSGNVLTVGIFFDTADFDPGPGVTNLVSVGYEDVFVQKMDANGNFLWARSFGGNVSDYGYSISLDTLGNVYTTGYFNNTVDFDPGPGTNMVTSAGNNDVFVQKMDANGNFIWVKTIGGPDDDRGFSVCIDVGGNVYATGLFTGMVDFDPGIGTSYLSSVGVPDAFVLKMDANGNFLWAKGIEGNSAAGGLSITVDSSGDVYTYGFFQGTVDFNPGIGEFDLTSAGSDDVFLQKMDANGNFIWALVFGGISYDETGSIKVDALGNIYITGLFAGIVDFNPGPETYDLNATGGFNFFVLKLRQYYNNKGSGDTSYLKINVYPNPTVDDVTVSISGVEAKAIEIIDIDGRIVWSNSILSNTVNINMKEFANTVYFVKVITEKESFIKKLVKQ